MSSQGQAEGPVLKRKIDILNQYGIHARPAALIVKLTGRFRAEVFFQKGEDRVSGKSIMGLMTLEASRGSKITVTAQGVDAEQVLDEIAALAARMFDEE